jgi:hypothetical protein
MDLPGIEITNFSSAILFHVRKFDQDLSAQSIFPILRG